MEEIKAEQLAIPRLYRTKAGKEIMAPGNKGVFVDETSREIAWPVYACTNPDCPGRGDDGEPHLFIWTDPRFFVNDQGKLDSRLFETAEEWRQAVKEAGGHRQPTCEQCLEIRNLDAESPQQRQEYAEYPQLYLLPSSAARLRELEAEKKEREEYIRKRVEEKSTR